jgi:hypothetical protein
MKLRSLFAWLLGVAGMSAQKCHGDFAPLASIWGCSDAISQGRLSLESGATEPGGRLP